MLDIEDVSASNGSSSVIKVIDGLGYGDDEDSKWAQEGMPASLIFDLGNISSVSKTRFSFYYFAEGRIYKYNVRVSPDGENWTEVLSEVYSKSEEWSEEEFAPVEARYLELEILSSSGPNSGNWATLWEAEIWGIGGINNIDNEDELAEEEDLIPSEFGISQNYPNPFNPSTKVEIMMKENGSARLDVYNLLGEKVIEVLNKDLIAGVHQINIDGSKLASGTYIYQLIINNKFAQSKKMQLMK
jgi:hypothetical protein